MGPTGYRIANILRAFGRSFSVSGYVTGTDRYANLGMMPGFLTIYCGVLFTREAERVNLELTAIKSVGSLPIG